MTTYKNRAAACRNEHGTKSVSCIKKTICRNLTPEGLEGDDLKRWNYQCYMQNYLRCALTLLMKTLGDCLIIWMRKVLAEDTIVVYSADHGFFLGDHGWYDKRFMYEESMRIPLLVRYPCEIQAEVVSEQIALKRRFRPDAARLRRYINSRGYAGT